MNYKSDFFKDLLMTTFVVWPESLAKPSGEVFLWAWALWKLAMGRRSGSEAQSPTVKSSCP